MSKIINPKRAKMVVGAGIFLSVHRCLKCAVYLGKYFRKLGGLEPRSRVVIEGMHPCLTEQEGTQVLKGMVVGHPSPFSPR